ncbi:MAG: UbiA prenyltransferase family protein [Desulfobacterales bacterium]
MATNKIPAVVDRTDAPGSLAASPEPRGSSPAFSWGAYIAIARPDHWFKNIFMLLGVCLAFFMEPQLVARGWLAQLLMAVAATCLIASSNYVINEILDAPLDRLHPTKKYRPVPSGQIHLPAAYLEWIAIGIMGLALAWRVNPPFFLSGAALWIAGLLYNIRPIRTKDIPYVDVLSESINNPIRLFLGWFALVPDKVPPLSLTIAYWLAGAFFMGAKRFAEYRMINDSEVAGAYRRSFKFYNESRLLVSLFCYATGCAFFTAIFVVRYHLELILIAPLIAGFFACYMRVALKPNSPVQHPEKLYREKTLMLCAGVTFIAFILLLFTNIPYLYQLFNFTPVRVLPLWVF